MNLRLIALAGACIVVAGLSACATEEIYYGPSGPYADVDYDAYYDGYYGPFVGGYWGAGGSFYYWDQAHRHYHRDPGAHFRHEGAGGFNPVHGHAPAGGGGRPPGGAHRP